MRSIKIASVAIALVLSAFTMSAYAACGPADLAVPPGNTLKFHAFATGVQIYHWTGGSWVFDAPRATLYADPGYHGQVGIHYVGPTWESNSGSLVQGAVDVRCAVDATAIPWLLLHATMK